MNRFGETYMNPEFYEKNIKCPVCNNEYHTLRVRSKACRVEKKDEDFCTHYKGVNPLFYEIIVCPCCAYSASESTLGDLSQEDIHKLKETFSGKLIERSFCSERSLIDAIDSFKLALYTANIKKAKNSIIAGLCLRLAWLYRFAGDEKENVFLKYALENYQEAFSKEKLPIGSLDEVTMLYLLGELSRRAGMLQEAIVWFSKAVASPERKNNPRIERLAREQWGLVREAHNKGKADAI